MDEFSFTFALNDLGCEVLWRAAERPGAVLDSLGESKIGDLHMSFRVYQNVLGLEVAVDNILQHISSGD